MTGVWQTTVPKTKTGKQVGTAYLNLFALKLKQNYTDYNVELMGKMVLIKKTQVAHIDH